MQMIIRASRWLLVALCLCSSLALAALPDPVTFNRAIEQNDIVKVRGWLDEGLNPEFHGAQFGTGLMIAAWYGHIDLMALFVERGANPRRSNQNGEQALQLAVWNNHTEAARWLLDHGAMLNRDGQFWGALHYAVFNGHQALANELIARGADVNARTPNGSTPLMLAARENREELAKTLLESGADPKLSNDWDDTALTMAMRYDHFRLGKMLASPEEFAIAVKAPKENFGEPVRSASAPSEIETILQKIREAEANGQPSLDLHKQLLTAVEAFRRASTPLASPTKTQNRTMPQPFQPKSIVITASRNRFGGERAQIVASQPAAKVNIDLDANAKPAPVGSIRITPVDERAKQAQIAELMRQIRLREAQGAAADALRQQLSEAVDALRR